MKDFIIALLVTGILILLFSTGSFPDELLPKGNGPQYPGDSGIVLPGNGSEPAEMISGSQKDPEYVTEEKKEPSVASEEVNNESEGFRTDTTKEEQNNMNEILLAFWHGVATVLIGETVALMVCIAWMKIKGDKNG